MKKIDGIIELCDDTDEFDLDRGVNQFQKQIAKIRTIATELKREMEEKNKAFELSCIHLRRLHRGYYIPDYLSKYTLRELIDYYKREGKQLLSGGGDDE